MDPLKDKNLETDSEKYAEPKTIVKTSKNLFSGNKSVKKGSDCTQKFLSSLSHTNKNQIHAGESKKKTFDSKSWSKELNNHKKMKFDHPSGADEKKNINEDANLENMIEEKQPIPLKQYDSVPVDFSICGWARFQSNESLEWCCENNNNIVDHSIFYFVTEQAPDSSIDTNRVLFENCMYYYSFPETTLESFYFELVREKNAIPVTELLHPTDIEIVNSWKERQLKWKNSITSLFGLFLAEKCPIFYCDFPKFTIMFKSPSVGGVDDFMAVMSTSARRIRDILDNLKIEYKMPFLKKNLKPTAAPDSENLRALKEMETKIPDQINFVDKSEYSVDYQSESLLYFEGKENLKKYFNFLVSFYEDQQEIFLPFIYSRNPFLYSTIQKLQVSTKQMLNNDLKPAYTLKLEGPIFPEIIPTICSLLEKTQKSFFVKLRSNPSTTYFGKAIGYVLEKKNSTHNEKQSEADITIESLSNKAPDFLMRPVKANLPTNSRIDWEDGKYLLNEKREL